MGCWDPLFPPWALASSAVTWTEREGCQGSLVGLFPCRGCWGGAGWADTLLKALHTLSCWPLPPSSSSHDLNRELGTRKPLQPHLFPFLPSFCSRCALPPQGWERDNQFRLLSGQPLETPPWDPLWERDPQSCSATVLKCLPPQAGWILRNHPRPIWASGETEAQSRAGQA